MKFIEISLEKDGFTGTYYPAKKKTNKAFIVYAREE